jgi:streptogramin lyase
MFGFILHAKAREKSGTRKSWRSRLVVEALESRYLLSFTTSVASGATDIVLGPNGTTMYWTANGTQIGSYDDATGFGGEVTIPGARFLAKIAVGADGFLYAADSDPNSGGRSDLIWRIDPVTLTGTALRTPTPNSLPWGITAGADGNIWFTESWFSLDGTRFSNTVGMIDVVGGTYAITEFPTPSAKSLPKGIIPGPADTDPNSVWFIEQNARSLGRIDLTTHVITEFDAGAPDVPPYGLGGQNGFGFASDGTNLVFCEFDVSKVGAFDPVAQRNIGNFPTPHLQDTEAMTLAADGQLYMTDYDPGLGLLRFDPGAMEFTGEAQVPSPGDVYLLAPGPGAPSGFPDVWLTNPAVHRVDRYEIDGMPLVPSGRGGVRLTPEHSSALRGMGPAAFPRPASGVMSPRSVDTTDALHVVTPPLQSLPETTVPRSVGATQWQATDAVFASSHRSHPPAQDREFKVEGAELGSPL